MLQMELTKGRSSELLRLFGVFTRLRELHYSVVHGTAGRLNENAPEKRPKANQRARVGRFFRILLVFSSSFFFPCILRDRRDREEETRNDCKRKISLDFYGIVICNCINLLVSRKAIKVKNSMTYPLNGSLVEYQRIFHSEA